MKKINLAEVLLKEMAVFDCESFDSKEEMFDIAALKFKKEGFVTSVEAFKEALNYRETLGPTYMGNLVAVPHGKCREVLKPGIVFYRCKDPFVYKSAGESGLVKYIFVLAISEDQEDNYHLRVLAALAGMLAHKEFIKLLEEAADHEELIHGINQLKL